MLPFPVYDTLSQPDFFIARPLVEVTFQCRFKAARSLEDHLLYRPYVLEIQAVAANSVNADIADHKHAKLAFAFRFRPHEPGEYLCLFGVCFDNSHILVGSLPFAFCTMVQCAIGIGTKLHR